MTGAQSSFSVEHGGPRNSVSLKIEPAFRIVARYRNRLPTVAELQNDFGMSRATAYRWLSAMKAAQGVAA